MSTSDILNLVVAIARAMDIDPEELAALFNDREINQAFYDQLATYQRALDDQPAPHCRATGGKENDGL